ncbi:MAG TPA: hypoxanthine phosphoribosyltransferase [Bacteroidales bacterium]|jgi:hypoxanthine phosphoribosyltransferase|nr:hypoxanthine phosphoribosyltransferase [Bacteroidales bacterium]
MYKITLLDKQFSLFIPPEKIQSEVQHIADRINEDLKDEEVVFIGILNGAFMFASDLLRKIDLNAQVSFVKLTSYQGTMSSGKVKSLIGINEDLKDKSVVIIEDIIDTGNTIESIINQIKGFRPRQVFVATLLFKTELYTKDFKIDYVGFRIPKDFVVGYGLDYQGYGRNLRGLYKIIE